MSDSASKIERIDQDHFPPSSPQNHIAEADDDDCGPEPLTKSESVPSIASPQSSQGAGGGITQYPRTSKSKKSSPHQLTTTDSKYEKDMEMIENELMLREVQRI